MEPQWNFYKYLVSHHGEVLGAFDMGRSVGDIAREVEKAAREATKVNRQEL